MNDYTTFDSRNNLLKRLDKLIIMDNKGALILYKTLGAYSVTSQEPQFWQHLENFLSQYEAKQQPQQPLKFQEPTDIVSELSKNKIDEFTDAVHILLDKRI